MWCSITLPGTPGRSDGSHANTLEFSRRKVMSALSYLVERVAPMVTEWFPSSPNDTFLVSLPSSKIILLFLEG